MIVKRKEIPLTGNFVNIQISHNHTAIVDAELYPALRKYHWRAEKSHNVIYAIARIKRNGKTTTIRMHRLVMNCPPDKFVHHINHNSLDNRRENLLNVTQKQHFLLHILS